MRAERTEELARKVADNFIVSTTWDIAKVLGDGIWFKFSVNILGIVPTPSDLLQKFDSRRVPPLSDAADIAQRLQSG